ncbi:MAG: DEAD/DEAH box helicase, partial [Pyrinomonadaceae bacterium]
MNEPQDLNITADAPAQVVPHNLAAWKARLAAHVSRREKDALAAVQPALNAYPADPELLLLAALAALLDKRPDQSLRYQHRFAKKFSPIEAEDHLLHALALAQQERWTQAAQILKQHGQAKLHGSIHYLPCGWSLMSWIRGWLNKIKREEERRTAAAAQTIKLKKPAARPSTVAGKVEAAKNAVTPAAPALRETIAAAAEALPPDLPRSDAQISVEIDLPATFNSVSTAAVADLTAFRLRHELVHLGLLQGFDELLCVPALHNVETYWYQTEAARKVLKQFRGRVLLADEVGLGKTIEAGMVLKEYLLRGMAKRVLILTPATLVGQWQEEMGTKFDVAFATSYDNLLRQDALSFWAQPRVIASIATARRAEHFTVLAEQTYDLVIVDEAHHLKNRQTQNWKLVNALQKRFLLLLSATPVQNSLVELYNLLTLLKPGIFKTEKEFRQSYMTSGHPRVPANRERMRDLMRDVMIRNTRSLVDVRLPPRHAVTMRLEAHPEEAACY